MQNSNKNFSNQQSSQLQQSSKKQTKKIALIATLTVVFLLICTGIGVTYAFFTDRVSVKNGAEFGLLAVDVDYTDNTKQHSTLAFTNAQKIIPGEQMALNASITSAQKSTNDLIDSATGSSYLRLKLTIEGFEDATLTTPVDALSQEKLDFVVQNIAVKSGVSTWIKSADGYIYYAGNTNASRRLEWVAGRTDNLAGNVYITFPQNEFSSVWVSRYCKLTLSAEVFQYQSLDINYATCADDYDVANCASSLILDYNQTTGLGTNVCALHTSYCTTAKTSFTKNQAFTISDLVGNASSLRVYQAGAKITASSSTYTLTAGNPSTVAFKQGITQKSLYLACSQYSIQLKDSEGDTLYQTVYGKQNGTLPNRVEVPTKTPYSFMGYYTARNGGGTLVYNAQGSSVVTSTSANTLYAYFIIADATLSYRDTIKAYQGDTAFTQAFTEAQTLDTLSAEITIFRDFTLTQRYVCSTNNMQLTIKSIKKANNEYCTLAFSSSVSSSAGNGFDLTGSKPGNTWVFENINLTAPSDNTKLRGIIAENNNVSIRGNVQISNFAQTNGGAIYVHKGNIDIYGENTASPDVVFTNCKATNGSGGAIVNIDSTHSNSYETNIVNAKFESCTATGNGGAVAFNGCNGTIENCSFMSNTVSGSGGAIWVTDSAEITINSGTFNANTATAAGGVIYGANANTQINIKGGTFTNNKASDAGGVLYLANSAKGYISGGVFGDASKTACATSTSNSNSGVTGGGAITLGTGSYLEIFSTKTSYPIIAYNYGGENINFSGGAIRNLNSTLKIYKGKGATNVPEIRYNCATRGGAIYCYKNTTSGTDSVKEYADNILEGCKLIYNHATYGGAYYCRSANANNMSRLFIKDGALIDSNTSSSGYGGIGGALGYLEMSGGTVSNNVANGTSGGIVFDVSGSAINISGGEISGNSSSGGGGVLIANGVTANITGGKITNNRSTGSGAGVSFASGSLGSISNAEISGNTAGGQGGGLWLNSAINVTNCTISNNTATDSGGGVYCYGSFNGKIENCIINGNTTSREGGGVFSVATNTIFKDLTITNNHSTLSGGGIHVWATNFDFQGSISVINNVSEYRGGGISMYSARDTDYNMDCNLVVKGNQCTAHAGGLRFQFPNCTVYLKRGIICDNISLGSGGGIVNAWNSGTLVLDGENIRIYNNTATTVGGGIYLEAWNNNTSDTSDDYSGNLIVNSGYIYGNTANQIGGGIYANSSSNSANGYSVVTINSGEIYGNTCATSNVTTSSPYHRGGGGAICAVGYSQIVVNGGKIYGNSTTATGTSSTDYGGGGAICMAQSSRLTINGGQIGGDTFSNANSAPNGYGGAIMLGNTTTCTITGGVIGSAKATTYATSTACANYAKSGGAIWVGPQASLTIEAEQNQNPNISWNYETSAGLTNETVFNGGGGAFKAYGIVLINQSKTGYDSNTVCYINYNGGANATNTKGIYILNGSSRIKNTSFTGNNGHALRYDASGVQVDSCRFIDNNTIGQLCAIGSSTITNCYASGGQVTQAYRILRTNITLTNCESYNCKVGFYIAEYANNILVQNCKAQGAESYGMQLNTVASCTLTVLNSSITGCGNGTTVGSGIYLNRFTTAKIVGCTISDNYGTFGSAIYNEGGYAEIQGCTIEGNRQTRSGAVTALPTTVSSVTYNPQTYITGIRGNEILHTSDLTTSNGWAGVYADRFTATYNSSAQESTLSCLGAGDWEHWYKTVNLTAGKTYLISADYEILERDLLIYANNLHDYLYYGMKMQLTNARPGGTAKSIEAGGGGVDSTYATTGTKLGTKSRMFIEYTCTSSATYYINFNFGCLADGTKFSFKIKNIIVSEYTKGSATIINNNTRVTGANGYGGAGVTNGANSPMGLHNVTISNNTNNISNSAAGIISDSGIQISACNIFGNTSTAAGAGLKLGAGNKDTIICAGTNFYNNKTTSSAGGAIYTDGNTSPVAILGANIYNNTCSTTGGGITAGSPLYLIAANIYGNTSGGNGGGVYVSSTLCIHASTVIGGTNAQTANKGVDGGGVAMASGNCTMYGGCIGNPEATEHATQTAYGNYGRYGGGIVLRGGTFTMNGGKINYNWATGNSGGLCSGFPTTLTGGEVAYNGSVAGGGVVVYDGSATLSLTGTAIHHNFATGSGGGLIIWSALKSTATMTGGSIYANEASGAAGVWMRTTNSNFTMSGGEIYSNKATNNAGGIHVTASSTFTMSGGTIRDNIAGTTGGGVELYGTMVMSNGTITQNTAGTAGGGVWIRRSSSYQSSGGTITGNLPEDLYRE